jgi:hypothetical protein
MTSKHTFDDKGKVQPKPTQEVEGPQKGEGPVTVDSMKGKLDANTITRMQQTLGNAAVQRFLAQRSGQESAEIDDETASTINSTRGGGQSLDENVASQAGEAMGHDFSDVNVHTDSQSNELNKSLGAKAFTTGKDIFFRDGAYNPGSDDGQRLISHELTHVVQQSGNTSPGQGKMKVNDPNDQYEGEADKVAESVMSQTEDEAAQREDDDSLRRQPLEEEEEELMPKRETEQVARQEEEEEPVALQEEEEEPVALQEEEEELPVQAMEEDISMQNEEEIGMQEEEEEALQPARIQMQEIPEEEI